MSSIINGVQPLCWYAWFTKRRLAPYPGRSVLVNGRSRQKCTAGTPRAPQIEVGLLLRDSKQNEVVVTQLIKSSVIFTLLQMIVNITQIISGESFLYTYVFAINFSKPFVLCQGYNTCKLHTFRITRQIWYLNWSCRPLCFLSKLLLIIKRHFIVGQLCFFSVFFVSLRNSSF